ncbi:hypothetical protein CALVIDRAFT_408651 [Calocera viscosa TUFC12733]|uniref:Uncharacterized protein n=1 Tax=Calocera viscosa (strain TUFC12733) TaxID=1330018 RepID=A0A167G9L6_CALVF|nr:hypothetical protein CALVIDRAFT_408651 [Calocera viscosa TUFC12733]
MRRTDGQVDPHGATYSTHIGQTPVRGHLIRPVRFRPVGSEREQWAAAYRSLHFRSCSCHEQHCSAVHGECAATEGEADSRMGQTIPRRLESSLWCLCAESGRRIFVFILSDMLKSPHKPPKACCRGDREPLAKQREGQLFQLLGASLTSFGCGSRVFPNTLFARAAAAPRTMAQTYLLPCLACCAFASFLPRIDSARASVDSLGAANPRTHYGCMRF